MSDTENGVKLPEELYIKEEEPDPSEKWLDIKEESVDYSTEADADSKDKFSSLVLPPPKQETGDGSITDSQNTTSFCKEANFGIHQNAPTKEIEYSASCDTTDGFQPIEKMFMEGIPHNGGKKPSTSKARHIVNHRTVEWTSCLIIDLLDKIRSKPILWDVRNPSFHKKTLRRSNFDVICSELKLENPQLQSLTTDEVIAKFAYLRGHYQKQLRKMQKTPSGSGGIVQSKWDYLEACSFLMPIYTKSNITTSSQSEEAQEFVLDGIMEELSESSETSPLTVNSPEPSSSSLSPVPTVTFPPSSPATQTKKRKHLNNQELVHEKFVEAVNGVNSFSENRRNTVTMKNDLLALTVSSVLSHIPDSHQHLKDEFAAEVMCLAANTLKKYNSEKYGL